MQSLANPLVLGYHGCTKADSVQLLGAAHDSFTRYFKEYRPEEALPENRDTAFGPAHALDCAVLNHLHNLRAKHTIDGRPAPLPPFDTVRGLYQEGSAAFRGSRIMEKTHIQLCVRTPERSIKGYFRVPEPHLAAA